MRTPINEKEIAILMDYGYTRSEAIKSINFGTEIYDDIEQLAEDFDVTVDEIRSGKVEDLHIVKYDGTEYGLAISH